MSNAKNINLIAKLQRWLDTRHGQMFMNYTYSWGASIVILGALFKLTHMSGADLMLFLGMGTEVFVFFIAGFERPFGSEAPAQTEGTDLPEQAPVQIIGSGESLSAPVVINAGSGIPSSLAASAPVQSFAADAAGQLAESSDVMQDATRDYIDQLNTLTETLKRVTEQSARLTRDSEEMEIMNRTLTGINRFYEMQLRSVSAQSSTIDDVNEQTKMLAVKLAELNTLYTRMVEALKVNLKTEN